VVPPIWSDEQGRPLPTALAARAILSSMPRPTNGQSLERERKELPGQLADFQRELDATPQDQRERRERLAWQIRRTQKRMAEVERRLAGS
jgi:hypothetical protein